MTQAQRRAAITGLLGLLLTALVGLSQVVSVRHNPAATMATPPAATMTVPDMNGMPHTRRPKPVDLDLTECLAPVEKVHYFADTPVRSSAHPYGKESAHADGPPLLISDLFTPAEMKQPSTVNAAISTFWARLCVDPAFTATTAAGFDPDHSDANSHLTGNTWSGALDFNRSQGGWSYAKGARLVYKTPPAGYWTNYMLPAHGQPPYVGYTPYPHGASRFLEVPRTDKQGVEDFRIACGGQWVGPYARTPLGFRKNN